jgi:hypothetical protein
VYFSWHDFPDYLLRRQNGIYREYLCIKIYHARLITGLFVIPIGVLGVNVYGWLGNK